MGTKIDATEFSRMPSDNMFNLSVEADEADPDQEGVVFPYHFYGLPVVIPMSMVMVVIITMTIIGNSMVILTIVRHRGMRTRTNMFITNLAVADILVAVLAMPVSLITLLKGTWIFGSIMCHINGFLIGLGFMLSIHTLMWISVHKCISIVRPFSRSMNFRRIIFLIVLAWGWSIFYNTTPIMGWTKIVYKRGSTQCGPMVPVGFKRMTHSICNTVFNFIMPLVVMSVCYFLIFKEVRQHMKRMRATSNMDLQNSLMQQKSITTTLFIVMAMFLVCWTPYILYSSMLGVNKNAVPMFLNPLAYWCGYLNSACNPVIYALRSPSFRQGYLEIICGRRKSSLAGDLSQSDHTHSLVRMATFLGIKKKKHPSTFFRGKPKSASFPGRMRNVKYFDDRSSPLQKEPPAYSEHVKDQLVISSTQTKRRSQWVGMQMGHMGSMEDINSPTQSPTEDPINLEMNRLFVTPQTKKKSPDKSIQVSIVINSSDHELNRCHDDGELSIIISKKSRMCKSQECIVSSGRECPMEPQKYNDAAAGGTSRRELQVDSAEKSHSDNEIQGNSNLKKKRRPSPLQLQSVDLRKSKIPPDMKSKSGAAQQDQDRPKNLLWQPSVDTIETPVHLGPAPGHQITRSGTSRQKKKEMNPSRKDDLPINPKRPPLLWQASFCTLDSPRPRTQSLLPPRNRITPIPEGNIPGNTLKTVLGSVRGSIYAAFSKSRDTVKTGEELHEKSDHSDRSVSPTQTIE